MLEFALVAAPLIALLLAALETSLVFFAESALQSAVERTARLIATGETQAAGTSASNFKQAACQRLPAFLKCDNLLIDVRKASSFATVDTSKPNITLDSNGKPTNTLSYDIGVANDIIIVRMMYVWPVPVGPLGWDLGDVARGQHLLIATSVAKTEPYKS